MYAHTHTYKCVCVHICKCVHPHIHNCVHGCLCVCRRRRGKRWPATLFAVQDLSDLYTNSMGSWWGGGPSPIPLLPLVYVRNVSLLWPLYFDIISTSRSQSREHFCYILCSTRKATTGAHMLAFSLSHVVVCVCACSTSHGSLKNFVFIALQMMFVMCTHADIATPACESFFVRGAASCATCALRTGT